MRPSLQKKSGLMQLKVPMKPSILTRPNEKVKQEIEKVLQTYKPK
jgi:hypothetical protein